MAKALTTAEEEYLEAIYRLVGQTDPVPLGRLAEELDYSPVSVNEMVRKMADKDLVHYTPYAGVSLTTRGRQRAEQMLRCHRLWERFLTDVLGVPWDRVHDEACRLEHVTSDLLETYLVAYLHDPDTCPHGRPLPGMSGQPDEAISLDQLERLQTGRVLALLREDQAFLSVLGREGLRPGAIIEVREKQPELGMMRLQIGEESVSLAPDVARQILVLPLPEAGQNQPSESTQRTPTDDFMEEDNE
jgi:DtxR family Mn-dependent transcriptional regulator